ncbi:hypothetical protein Tco_0908915 [Tanacetum coccineum]|uniref:Transposase (Putative), gypsy type n=1 Tax=Tanacetum coccineum TaxID=301880 RepID=A0ABQ5CNP0_9ASTR
MCNWNIPGGGKWQSWCMFCFNSWDCFNIYPCMHAWSEKALDAFCNKFHIPEEVHPVLPNRNDTMHERPARKIVLYTRFFNFANFRLPLSTFLVEFSKRSDNAFVCYTKPIDSLKNWNDHFFWVDDFACPASFPWHAAKHVIRDPAPVAADFNEQDYATLVAHPSLLRKFPEAFICLTTIGRTVLLLPVTPDRAESELDASVERIFYEGGSDNQTGQGDSAGREKDVDIQPVIEVADTVVEDVALVQSKRQGKRKFVVVDAGEASHPPKKLREDHKTPSGTSIGASISIMPECEGRDHIDSVAGLNLHAIGAPLRFVISSDSSHHSGTNVAEAEVNSLVRSFVPIMTTVTTITSTVDPALVAKEKLVEPSLFCVGSSLAGGTDPTMGGFLDLIVSDFLVGAIHTVIDPDTDLQKNYVPQWSMTNRSRLNDGRFNVGAARQMCLSAEVRMRVEYNVKEKMRLKSVVERQVELREWSWWGVGMGCGKDKITINSVKSQNDNLVDRVRELEISSSGLQKKVTVYENCMDELEKFQDDRMKVANDKFDKLYTDFVEMALHLEEKFYPHLLTTISGRRWLLTHGMELAIVKCLNSHEYLFFQLCSSYRLRSMNFSLLAKLKSNKDASVKTVMDILHLEGPLAEKLRLNELQPDVDQLMVHIHHSSDKFVLGATALSLSIDVYSVRVRKIRENIARDVFVSIVEPLSSVALEGTEGTSGTVPETTTALSVTFAPVSSIPPISVDDYEITHADDQGNAGADVDPFPNVDDAELIIS